MIIRRQRMGDWSEAINIELSDKDASRHARPDESTDGQASIVYVGEKGDWLLYDVELPPRLRLKPPDLRRYGSDPDKVRSLVSQCLEDNVPLLIFELSLKSIEKHLATALYDLSSAMDLERVECRRLFDGTLSVDVFYRDFAGAQRMLTCEYRI